MSTLNVNELNAPADHNFEIKVDDGELLNIDGTLGLNPLSHFKLPVGLQHKDLLPHLQE